MQKIADLIVRLRARLDSYLAERADPTTSHR